MRGFILAISDAGQAAVRSAWLFLEATKDGRSTPLGADLYLEFGGRLVELRQRMTDAGCFDPAKLLRFSQVDLKAYSALRSLADELLSVGIEGLLAGKPETDLEAFAGRLDVTVELLREIVPPPAASGAGPSHREACPVPLPPAIETSGLSDVFAGSPEEARACLDWLQGLDEQTRLMGRVLGPALHIDRLTTEEARQVVRADLHYRAEDYLKLLLQDSNHLARVGPGMRRWIDPAVRELCHALARILRGESPLEAIPRFHAAVQAASRPFDKLYRLLVLFLLQHGRAELVPQQREAPSADGRDDEPPAPETKAQAPGGPSHEQDADWYIDLDSAAAVVNRSKRGLEHYKRRKEDPLPEPDIPGGGGRKDEWKWSTIRPWLERTFRRDLSSVNPSGLPRGGI
jgi:hypothetical protein